MFDILTTTGLAAGFAAVAAGWSHVKSLTRYVTGAVLLQKSLDIPFNSHLALHLRTHYKRLPSGVSSYKHYAVYIDKNQYPSLIPYDMPDKAGIWYGPRGIFYVSVCDSKPGRIVSLRKFSDPRKLICDALDQADSIISSETKERSNFYVRLLMGTVGEAMRDFASRNLDDIPPESRASSGINSASASEGMEPDLRFDQSFRYEKHRYINNASNSNPLRGLSYPEEIHGLIADLTRWFERRDWYRDRSIPWRTGVLLHGPGGTGKSSLSKAVGQTLGIPVYQYSLNTFNDRDFVKAWNNMDTPCVVALEDIDTVFHGRESVTVHQSLSFECMLNQISGISARNGILLMVTTNHLEHVDPALGQLDEHGCPTRPGRIDRIIYMGPTTLQQRRDIAEYTAVDYPDLIEKLVEAGDGKTAAQFQRMCVDKVLRVLDGVDDYDAKYKLLDSPIAEEQNTIIAATGIGGTAFLAVAGDRIKVSTVRVQGPLTVAKYVNEIIIGDFKFTGLLPIRNLGEDIYECKFETVKPHEH